MLWAYQNTRKFFRRSTPNRNNSVNGNDEAPRNTHCNHTINNNIAEESNEVSQIITSETMTLSPGTEINEEEQLPPKYEDIESHPIVAPHPLSVNYAEDTLPPKYEDILER